ncbi:NAD(P)/FAD-dependent oxidoreductase [Campylobacter sp.]|uniref:NAD(P)/FAD-dependent oxidoreductase n=1 Tax=Campylobacter sp. TaxID=205 RepID=UPI0027106E26|nr:aminoacetone oxidase family FAD-binding enzyme [Campylobacter sp.]
MDKIYDVLIIGAGASGLFLAANLQGKSVAILEKNSCAGKKILASGGGRCNITNRYISAQNYLADEEFIARTLLNLDFRDVLEFFSELKFEEIKQNQFFCKSSAKDVLAALLKEARGAQIFYNADVKSVSKNQNEIFEIATLDERVFYAQNLVVASGGLSYKALGASDVAYKIAENFGLQVSAPSPALVGFTVQKDEFWFKNLSGVSLNAEISLNAKNIAERKFSGDVLFTHKGISGPAILNASLFWQKGTMSLNFLPNFSFKNLNSKKQLSTILPLPKRFTLEFLSSKNLSDKPFSEYERSQKDKILEIFNYRFAPAGTFGFERAEVTKGGVFTSELSLNFESKKEANLYFIGEAVDVTGMLGGYNFHFAFSSAKAAANHLNSKPR